MSIRTNRMKAVPSLQRRLTSVKSREEPNISDKLDKLMADLTAIKDLFSTVKSNEDELLDTLKLVDDLLRNFKTDKFFDISKRILETDKPTNADPQKGINEPSSSQKAEEKSGKRDETIDEKMENLEYTLENLKANLSTLKKNEELRRKLREVENFLQNFNSKLAEDANENETKGLEQPTQTSREEMNQDLTGGTDKPSSSQESRDKKIVGKVKSSSAISSEDSKQSETKSSELPRQKSRDESDQDLKATGIGKSPPSEEEEDKKSIVEKDVGIDERFESLKFKLDKMKAMSSTAKEDKELREKLRVMEDLLRNFNAKNLEETLSSIEDSNQSEKKSSELRSQTSRDELVDQNLKTDGVDKSSSTQESEGKTNLEKDVPIDEKLEVLKSELKTMMTRFSSVKENEEQRDRLRTLEDLFQNLEEIVKSAEDANQSETKGSEQPNQTSRDELVDQDLNANGIEKPPSSQETQDKKSNVEKDKTIEEKFESFMSKLDKIKGMPSTTKESEELKQKLRDVEDLIRKFNSNQSETKNLELPTQRKSDDESMDQGLKATGVDILSSTLESKEETLPEKYVPIDEKLESLKLELDNMKAKFSPVKENEEMRKTLRTLEDHLQSFDIPAEDANPSGTKGSELTSQISRGELEDQVLKDRQQEGRFKKLEENEENLLRNTNKTVSDENVERKVSKEEVVDKVVEAINKKIKKSTKKLGVSETETKANESSEKGKTSKTVHYPILSLSRRHEDVELVLKRFQASYDALNPHSKVCCLSLSIFPENFVMMKRNVIYWWIGEGFVKKSTEKTSEEEGEDVFDELLNSKLIVPHGTGKCPIVNKFKLNPWIRHMLVSSVLAENKQPFRFYSQITTSSHQNHADYGCLVLDQTKVQIGGDFASKSDHWRSVFNLHASYLTIEPQWMAKMKKLVVLQLGRWQESPKHHIEVAGTEFMTDSKAQKHLKYLSLRGISRISALPPSIAQLVSLEILDLKACHNLETLPNEITSLKKLTHLDVSQCYLLESMPKGIGKLSELQVLKGFVVGSSNKTPTVSDLANFKKLKRLSIHIGSEAVIQDKEFESLSNSQVKCLKISWGVSSNTKYKDIEIVLPQGLEKLNIEGFPSEQTPTWLMINHLPLALKKLYIIGGKLRSIHNENNRALEYCKVEILRLKYLKNLQIDMEHLRELFPSLRYAEVKQVSNLYDEWSIMDG
ncbi:uncharacterized protein LOC114188477 [Vigna unguiculata]|uniref:uncharacterized protein LOC114188477 n=1 Tax=Vigna unguiculata TaxID=3917 RepID=UPI0010170465|nr:uncharacterized protein LOC114188477 [Vigna unguiculata]